MSNTLKNLVISAMSHGERCKGVLTSAEAFERAMLENTLIVISSIKQKVFIFSDAHCFSFYETSSDFVPATSVFPMTVVPREGLEDGVIDTIEKFVSVFQKGYRQISTIEGLVEFIDNKRNKLNIT
jgi:hypothetical protein